MVCECESVDLDDNTSILLLVVHLHTLKKEREKDE